EDRVGDLFADGDLAQAREQYRQQQIGAEERPPGRREHRGLPAHLTGNGYMIHARASDRKSIDPPRIRPSRQRARGSFRVRNAKNVETRTVNRTRWRM